MRMVNDSHRIPLLCLPFVGANCNAYKALTEYTAHFIDVISIELPGRGKRFTEPYITDIHQIVLYIFRQIRHLIDTAYSLYGHSMGAYIAFLLSKFVLNQDLQPPVHLFVSGRSGPCLKTSVGNRHLLSDDHFLRLLEKSSGIPNNVLQDSELANILIPILRADFQAYESYIYEPGEPFDIPITVMIGTSDSISYEDALLWQKETTIPITVREFDGDHFFIRNNWAGIGRVMSETLSTLFEGNWTPTG